MNTILKFGKHKGKKISQIPLGYLAWLLTSYEGTSLSKNDIEKEAIRRGCEKRNGKWGIERRVIYEDSYDKVDFLGNYVTREYREDLDEMGYDDSYDYYGIPNMD